MIVHIFRFLPPIEKIYRMEHHWKQKTCEVRKQVASPIILVHGQDSARKMLFPISTLATPITKGQLYCDWPWKLSKTIHKTCPVMCGMGLFQGILQAPLAVRSSGGDQAAEHGRDRQKRVRGIYQVWGLRRLWHILRWGCWGLLWPVVCLSSPRVFASLSLSPKSWYSAVFSIKLFYMHRYRTRIQTQADA